MKQEQIETLTQVEAKTSVVWQGNNYQEISDLTGQKPDYKNNDKRTKALLIELEDQDEPHVLLIGEKVYIDMNDVLCIAGKEVVVAINSEYVANKNQEADNAEEVNIIVENEKSIIDEAKEKTSKKEETEIEPKPEPFPVPEGYTQKQFPEVSGHYHTKSKTSAGLHSQIKYFSIDRKRWFNGVGTYYLACVYCFKKIEVDVGNERFTKENVTEE